MDHGFRLLSISGNLWFDAWHWKVYLFQCGTFLYSSKHSWILFCDAVEFFKRLDFFQSYIYDLLGMSRAVLCLGPVIPCNRGKTFLSTLPNTQWVEFSSMVDWNSQSPQSCMGIQYYFLQSFQMVLFLAPSSFLIHLCCSVCSLLNN